MPKRNAKFIVSKDEDSLVLFEKDPHYHVKKNPRIKSRHPHETYTFYDVDEGSSTMTNWIFSNKRSAEQAYKRMKKRR